MSDIKPVTLKLFPGTGIFLNHFLASSLEILFRRTFLTRTDTAKVTRTWQKSFAPPALQEQTIQCPHIARELSNQARRNKTNPGVCFCFIELALGNRGPGVLNRGHRIYAHHPNLIAEALEL